MNLPRILVVDDDTAAIQLMHSLLAGEAEMLFARSGEQALKQVETAPPDLILMDVEMPGIGGIEACRRLKCDPRFASIPVIFVTSFGDEQKELAALRAGAVDFLSKPVTATQIQARVQAHWRLQQQVDGLLHQMKTAPLWAQRGEQPKLLLVEPDASTAAQLENELTELPVQVSTVASLEVAHAWVLEQGPDLVVFGTAVSDPAETRRFMALDALRRVPFLALTPAGDISAQTLALSAGVSDVLASPCGQGVLRARVGQLLQLRSQAQLAARQARENFHRLTDEQLAQTLMALPLGIVVVDAAGLIRLVNRWVCEQLEVVALSAVGADLDSVLPLTLPLPEEGQCSPTSVTQAITLQHGPPVTVRVSWTRSAHDADGLVTFTLVPSVSALG